MPTYEEMRAALERAEAELRRRGEREDALLADAYECERRARKALDAAQKRIEVLEGALRSLLRNHEAGCPNCPECETATAARAALLPESPATRKPETR